VSRVQGRRRNGAHIAAVLPAYNVSREMGAVLRSLPQLFTTIVVVNDASADQTGVIADRYAELDRRIVVVHHDRNQGVGGAMITGFRTAVNAGADVVVKIDADGQMPLWLVPELIAPLLSGAADYTKGNRFRDFQAVRAMPLARRVGNVALSFLAKAATGYWRVFDPTNGFVAIRSDVLSQLPLQKVDPSYYFEISMLSNLYLIGAVVREVPMPARYAGETSSLSIPRVLRQFPGRLLASLARRLVLKNFVYDFNLASLDLAAGIPLFVTGLAFGIWNWIRYSAQLHAAAPTGTVVLPALMIMVGVQLLLSAAQYDLEAVPRDPVNQGPIGDEETPPRARRTDRRDSEIAVRRGAGAGEGERLHDGDLPLE
jgi:dolichol-phosphate mannosyltransferase